MRATVALPFSRSALLRGFGIMTAFALVGLFLLITGWTGLVFRNPAFNRVVGAAGALITSYMALQYAVWLSHDLRGREAVVADQESLTSWASGLRRKTVRAPEITDIEAVRQQLTVERRGGRRVRIPTSILNVEASDEDLAIAIREVIVDSDAMPSGEGSQ